ncbi:TetR/AcrR family transcriptional regulator [Pseudomonas sp. Marseille-QA0892]
MKMPASPKPNDVRAHILLIGQQIMARKGFSAVGLSEILTAAGVPKVSFYHYFGSKDAFGEAMLRAYFEAYFADTDTILATPGLTMAERLMRYWQSWRENQSYSECQGKCLAVKLGAEVADLSEAMRLALDDGAAGVIGRLARAIEAGVAEGSLAINGQPTDIAQSLYQLWLGASVMAKIMRSMQPFDTALVVTRQTLHISA